MLEKDYKKEIREELKKIGAKTIPLVTGILQSKGEPDILGSLNGKCFVIEAKVDKNYLSVIQVLRLKEWQASGAIVIVAVYPTHTAKEIAGLIYARIMATSEERDTISTDPPIETIENGSRDGENSDSLKIFATSST